MNKLKKEFKNLLSLKDHPERLAKGFALGSFIGMMPIPGFQMMVSLSIATIIKVNKKAAVMGVFNTNMATGLFIFAFNFWLGKTLLGIESSFAMPEKLSLSFAKTILDAGSEVYLSLILGGTITGLVSAAISYWLVKRFLYKKQEKEMKTDKVYTIISGASQGLGKAISTECAQRKMNLILIALPNEGLKDLANNLQEKYKIETQCFEIDLRAEDQLRKTIIDINTNFKVNILINNAGMGGSMPFEHVSQEYIDNPISLNMRSLVMMTHQLLPNLKKHSPSYILNIASLASFGPMPFKTIYPATKAFVYSFSRGLHTELKGTGVNVSVAHPGGMATNELVSKRINQHHPIIRSTILSPEKTAKICVQQMLKKDALIIPGFMNKLSYLFLKFCPVWLKLIIFRSTIQKELRFQENLCYE